MRNRRMLLGAVGLLLVPFAASGEAQAEAAAEEVTEITWMSPWTDAWTFQDIEERFGITVISNGINENDREKREVMLAAGEQPDIGGWWGNPLDHFEAGLTRAIPKAWIREYAPNLAAIFDQYPLAWIASENPENEDELIALHGVAVNTDGTTFYPMFRVDYARRLGFDLPSYDAEKIPLDRFGRVYYLDHDVAFSDYEALLRAFRDGDADGNGQNDTIPFGASDRANRNWQTLIGSFGVVWGGNRLVDGELTDWRTDPGMKEFLKRMAIWWEDGLIDQEFMNLSLFKMWEKVQSGVIGSVSEVAIYAGADYAVNRPPNTFIPDEELGGGREVVLIPPLVGPGGVQGATSGAVVGPVGSYPYFIASQVSDAKLQKILEILDYYMGTDEGYVAYQFGKENVHFDWEGDPWQSKPIVRPAEQVPDGFPERGGASFYPRYRTDERMQLILEGHTADWTTNYLLQPAGQRISMRPYKWDFFNDTNLVEVNQRVGETLGTMFNEYFLRALTGEIDVDDTWDDYVERWHENGGDEVLAELAKAPIVSELRRGNIVR